MTEIDQTNDTFEQLTQLDYFGFSEKGRYTLPDGISWIEFDVLNEGKRAKFQKQTRRDLFIERGGQARTSMDAASDRHALIDASVTGWNLQRQGRPVPFNSTNLRDFLQLANPKIIDGLEKAIRLANPWLAADLTVEQLDEEIATMQEMRQQLVEREQGEASSGGR